ncbi:MAG: YIP1 family protein, partial [Dehalococcoidia bacterium]
MMIDRMVRASQLDANLYEEVERDVNATGQAATVVLIAAVASGIGGIREGGIGGLITGVVGIFVAWLLWGALTYWIGKNVFGTSNTRVTPGEMLRTLGFAMSPGILWVLGFIPILGWI